MQPAMQFFDAIRASLGCVQMKQVCDAAEIVAEALGQGMIVHTFGTGHSSLLAQELFYRAGGLAAVNPILDPRLGFERGAFESTAFERSAEGAGDLARQAGFRAGDAGIVISNSGANPLPIEMALLMKAAGLKVIGLTNVEQSRGSASRHSSGKRLFEIADSVLDNHCPPGDAAIEIEGLPQRLGPLSTIIGASILHAVVLEAAALLAAKGISPATLSSANVPGPSAGNLRTLTDPYRDRIRYFR